METSCVGVIFDCDGTLLDSMDIWRDMESMLAQRAGVTLSKKDTDKLTTLTLPEAADFFHAQFGLGESPQQVVQMIDEFMLDFYCHRAFARPGALAFVQDLARRGVRMSVASSSPQPYLQAGLERTGFAPYFEAVVSVDDVGVSKREPAVFDRARELMGTPLEATWGVEDSLYAVHTLNNARYCSLGIYDCDISATFDELKAHATRAITTFENLDAETFLAWAVEGRQGKITD